MYVGVSAPAAWCLAPLQEVSWISDPDIDDNPPRYSKPLDGGWARVHDAVRIVYDLIQEAELDVLDQHFAAHIDGELTRQQEAIVHTWFSESVAAQWSPGTDYWLNGRHRTWGLKQAGFDYAPVRVIPAGDAIQAWELDPEIGLTFDEHSLGWQQEELDWWVKHDDAGPWRRANPEFGRQWAGLLDRWDRRLATPTR